LRVKRPRHPVADLRAFALRSDERDLDFLAVAGPEIVERRDRDVSFGSQAAANVDLECVAAVRSERPEAEGTE
jgi:hypothetical protein